jgi:hypothetical protein
MVAAGCWSIAGSALLLLLLLLLLHLAAASLQHTRFL